ncbi:MAG: hypothetical protein WCC12_08965 [Anaerolineales bacterium]
MIELDQELITSLECPTCHTVEQVLAPMSAVTFEAGHCPTCGILREAQFTHVITGEENFLHRTLSSVGVPALHILRAQNGVEYRFYELTGDLPDALHFRHFEHDGSEKIQIGERIRLKKEVPLVASAAANSAQGRIRIKDEAAKGKVSAKPANGKIKFKQAKKKDIAKEQKASESISTRIRYKSVESPLRIISKLPHGRVKVCKL